MKAYRVQHYSYLKASALERKHGQVTGVYDLQWGFLRTAIFLTEPAVPEPISTFLVSFIP